MKRRVRVNAVNHARKDREFIRAYGSADRVAFVRSQPCVACGRTPSENAHTRGGGAGRKGDARFVAPLCHPCHDELHRRGPVAFAARHDGLDLDHEAAITDARYEQYRATQERPA